MEKLSLILFKKTTGGRRTEGAQWKGGASGTVFARIPDLGDSEHKLRVSRKNVRLGLHELPVDLRSYSDACTSAGALLCHVQPLNPLK